MGEYLDKAGLTYFWSKIKEFVPPVSKKSESFFIGKLDSTSTRTVMTAQVDGITELYTGLVILMDNNVAQSNTGVTLNVNNLGAKKIYSNTSDTALTTQWGTAYTALLYYDATRDSGNGGWVWYYGYDTNTNTIGYQIRSNGTRLPMKERMYRYRLMFTSADGTGYVPANTSTSTNATSARTPTTEKIDPFGRICYYGSSTALAAGDMVSASYQWDQYLVTMGYSFTPITMDDWKPVYLKTTPQTDGSVIIDPTNPYVQALPTTEDGFVYIFLGIAISTTQIELFKDHPVYWYKDGAVRQWTNAVTGGGGSTVSVSQTVTSGTELAGIIVDNVETKIYAPTLPTLATVATTGDYDDLSNKPAIPTVPTNVSAFNNDSGYLTGITSTDVTNALGYTPGTYSKPSMGIPASDLASGVIPDTSTFMVKGTDYVTAGKKADTTLGTSATAEGIGNTASGDVTHAEGYGTTAYGARSHAENSNTYAGGRYSHAEGLYTIANGRSQHVFGEYNIQNGIKGSTVRGTYVEIVGNGEGENTRSNARTLDWDGNEVLAGKLTVGAAPTNNMDVATKQYVDSSIPTVPTNVSAFTNDAGYLTSSTVPQEVFLVNVTITSQDMTSGTSDKSATEIYQAFTAGKLPVVKVSVGGTGMMASLAYIFHDSSDVDPDSAIFVYEDQSNNAFKYATMRIQGTTVQIAFKNGYLTSSDVDSSLIISALGYTPIQTESDPTVPAWAKASSKPSYSAEEISFTDVSGPGISATNVRDALSEVASSDAGKVPITRTVNGHALSSNVTVTASDVGAVPTTRTVNGKALSSDISLDAGDISYQPSSGTTVLGQVDYVAEALDAADTYMQGLYSSSGGDISGNVVLKAPAGSSSPSLTFQRGTLTDNYNDWSIQDVGGYLRFYERGQNSGTWNERVVFNTTGAITATTFSGQLSGTISSGTTATTQTAGDSSTKVATTAFVATAITNALAQYENGNTSTY